MSPEAVEMMRNRTKIEALQEVLETLELIPNPLVKYPFMKIDQI